MNKVDTTLILEISITCDVLTPHIELPLEFINLPVIDKLTILDGLICAIQLHIDKNLEERDTRSEFDVTFEEDLFISFSASINLDKTNIRSIVEFDFIKKLKKLRNNQIKRLLNSIIYLLQGTAVTIIEHNDQMESHRNG